MISQRDALIQKVIARLDKDNRNLFFLSADFGAPKLDILREKYPSNFIHCGISEQAMIDVASGLALEGNQVICYAMAPFISIRALEQIKCGPGLMNLPICIVSVGVGLGYADAGPTHYTTEDLTCLRSISNISIYTTSDSNSAENIIQSYLDKPHFSYLRLDRDVLKDIEHYKIEKKTCYRVLGENSSNKICIIAHGKTTHIANEVIKKDPDNFFVIDLLRCKPFPIEVIEMIKNSRGIITIDEQNFNGSLYSIVMENINKTKIQSSYISLPDNYIFENGGRDYLLKENGVSSEAIIELAKEFK